MSLQHLAGKPCRCRATKNVAGMALPQLAERVAELTRQREGALADDLLSAPDPRHVTPLSGSGRQYRCFAHSDGLTFGDHARIRRGCLWQLVTAIGESPEAPSLIVRTVELEKALALLAMLGPGSTLHSTTCVEGPSETTRGPGAAVPSVTASRCFGGR